MDYVDMSASAVGFVNWANVAPFMPERRGQQRSSSSKETPTPISGAPDFFNAEKGPSAPTAKVAGSPKADVFTAIPSQAKDSRSVALEKSSPSEISEVDRIAKQRVRLMAAKYATSSESAEMVARLEILNRRLLDRSPRISVGQVQALESAANQLANIRAAREEQMRRLGIEV